MFRACVSTLVRALVDKGLSLPGSWTSDSERCAAAGLKKIRDLTNGGGDYSFEAIGKKETAEQAFHMLRAGGTATVIGMIPQGTKIELDGPSFLREKRIQGSSMGSNRFRTHMPQYVEFYLQGLHKLDELVSRRINLEDINDAFEYMKEGSVARSAITF